jgi:uncharacterized protein YkwD
MSSRPVVLLACLALAGCGGREAAEGAKPPEGRGAAEGKLRPQLTDGKVGDAVMATDERPSARRLGRGGTREAAPPRAGVGAGADCPNPDLAPSTANLAEIEAATLCLMNGERTDRGFAALRSNELLREASVDHSQDMVDNEYFAHETPSGVDVVARLRLVGYVTDTVQWWVGENLAWGSGARATPRAIVQAWLDSPGHRANLLSPLYQEVGAGVVYGTPSRGAGKGATYTTDFGTLVQPAPAPASVRAAPQRTRTRARRCNRLRAKLRRAERRRSARRTALRRAVRRCARR